MFFHHLHGNHRFLRIVPRNTTCDRLQVGLLKIGSRLAGFDRCRPQWKRRRTPCHGTNLLRRLSREWPMVHSHMRKWWNAAGALMPGRPFWCMDVYGKYVSWMYESITALDVIESLKVIFKVQSRWFALFWSQVGLLQDSFEGTGAAIPPSKQLKWWERSVSPPGGVLWLVLSEAKWCLCAGAPSWSSRHV